jgi:Leucine-rich repeat (LRR) protein
VVSLSTAGGTSYSWVAPAGAQLSNPATANVVSATLTQAGLQTFTVVVSNGGTCSQTATVSVTGTGSALPTISGFAANPSVICVGSAASFTASVGNVTGSYAYTLTNGSNPLTGSSSSTSFSQSLVVSGSGSQSFSLVVSTSGGSVVATTNLTVGSHPDYQPLVDLYNSTNGAGWTNKTGWLQSCDPCTGNGGNPWYGLTCSGGRVNQLLLSSNGLSGSIPASLGSLTNLQTLNLVTNQLSGSIPASLGNLTNLQLLYLVQNQLSGSIPASLSGLTNLQVLNLSENQLSGDIPASLGSLANLQYLELFNNQLSGSIPATLGSLTNLKSFRLNNNQLSGSIPSTLGSLTNLTLFTLSTNQVSGSIPSTLGSLTNLQQLFLSGNQLSGSIPASLSALTNLTGLNLSDNQLSGSIPSTLGSLTNLQVLTLSTNQLSGSIPSTLGSLTNLQNLFLFDNQLSGSIPSSLGSLTNLTLLYLNSNQLTGCWPASLSAFCGVSSKSFADNAGLPGGGSATAFAAFCATGQGSEAFVVTATASAPTVNVGGVVSLSTAGGSSYSWIAPTGAQLSSPATASVVSATLTQAGLQTFTVVVSNGSSCSQTATVSVTVSSVQPTLAGLAPTPSVVCVGSPVTFTATLGNVTGSYTYTLTDGSSPLTGSSSSMSFSQSLVATSPGNQSFSLIIRSNDLSASATTSLLVNALPTASLQASGTITCAMSSVTLTASGGSSYSFSGPGLVSQNGESGTAVVNEAGTYSVTVTSAGGCSATATTLVSSNTTAATATILAPASTTLSCTTTSISLTATGGGTYHWDDNSANAIRTVTASGTYSVTVTASSGCTATASASITADQTAPSVSITPSSATLTCANPSATLTANGTGSFRWNTGSTESQISVSSSGTYSVTLTSPSGCTASTSVSVSTDQTAPSVSISPTSATLNCANPSVTLTAQGAGAFHWSTGSLEAQISVTTPGLYSVTMTSGNSCTAVATSTVENNINLVAPALLASATSTINQPISVTASGCSGTLNWLPQGGTGQSAGDVYTFSQPGNYTLSASCTVGACTSPQTTPLILQILPGSFAITKVTMVNCTLIDQARGSYQVQFTPQYVGQNGNPISFSVVNEMPATTAPAPYSLKLYNDNPLITLVANQVGNPEARFAYNWLASCQTGNNPNSPPTTSGIPNQTILVNQAYQLQLTNYFSDPDGQALTFSGTGLPPGLSLNGSLISGTPSTTGVSNVQITALDPGGLSAQTSFQLTVNPMPTTPAGFTIVGVSTVSCAVLSPGLRRITFTPQYGGTDSSPISFSVVNEMVATTNPGPYSLNLYTDNPNITLTAKQGASLASYVYNWLSVCNPPARVGSGEAPTGLQVKVLGNPVEGKSVEIEIRGVVGQAVQLNLVDLQGNLLHQQRIEESALQERVILPIGTGRGLILLQVNTAREQQQVKLLRP